MAFEEQDEGGREKKAETLVLPAQLLKKGRPFFLLGEYRERTQLLGWPVVVMLLALFF